MVDPKDIESHIQRGMECDLVHVDGDGHHFEAIIVSPLFAGKTRIKQHQLIYGVLGERMKEEIHALSMKTFTPEAWEKVKDQYAIGAR
ncbi:MAG: BolA/IbaG family iron-sulfur metabolism protein [Myxococcales bacterium]|nr:BolA/IbaG family iron-sulfur metabolism protein [Myxococcales bacterium]